MKPGRDTLWCFQCQEYRPVKGVARTSFQSCGACHTRYLTVTLHRRTYPDWEGRGVVALTLVCGTAGLAMTSVPR
jgi:hypothetical protein